MHVTLRPNEKIYINGAVLRADRKVSLELMNDVVFLLESHVMLEDDARTPLRRLYFVVQLMLMSPQTAEARMMAFNLQGLEVAGAYDDLAIQEGLAAVAALVKRGRSFEALKLIRGLMSVEDGLLAVEPEARERTPAMPSPTLAAIAPRRRLSAPAGRASALQHSPIA